MIELEDIIEMQINNNNSNTIATKEMNLSTADIFRLIKLRVKIADESGFVSSIF